ncbi:hypothetical protein NC652_014187 [Populus alba x Populus x berolinensis]|nr:hypothetical protein NC652_014187 [Populus alba x Populus x berolinensis]
MMIILHQLRSDISSSGRKSIPKGWLRWPANLTVIGFRNSINIWLT